MRSTYPPTPQKSTCQSMLSSAVFVAANPPSYGQAYGSAAIVPNRPAGTAAPGMGAALGGVSSSVTCASLRDLADDALHEPVHALDRGVAVLQRRPGRDDDLTGLVCDRPGEHRGALGP